MRGKITKMIVRVCPNCNEIYDVKFTQDECLDCGCRLITDYVVEK